jgi:hypothetical protein
MYEANCVGMHDYASSLEFGDLNLIATQVRFNVRAEVSLQAFVERV